MKKRIVNSFTKSNKNIRRFSGLLLFLILTLSLSAQQLDTLLIDTWTGSVWQRSSKQINSFDGSGFLTNSLTQTWDVPLTSWKNSIQTKYINNPDGTVLRDTSQTWSGSAWTNSSLTTFTYNGSKKVLTSTTQIFLISIWQNSLMQTNTYDGSGFLTSSLSQNWTGATWQNRGLTKYTNNLNGTVHIDTTQIWDGVSAWKNSERSTYAYNGSNKVTTITTDTLKTGTWQSYSLTTDAYDGSGFLTNALYQLWNTGSSSYKNDTQMNFTNNTNGTPSVVITQLWDGVSSWNNVDRLTYKYSSTTSNPELSGVRGITIYPNPARDVITIKGNNDIQGSVYSITNQAGKLVLKGRLNGNSTIDISSLANGVYFLNLGEKSQKAYKIIKNR